MLAGCLTIDATLSDLFFRASDQKKKKKKRKEKKVKKRRRKKKEEKNMNRSDFSERLTKKR